jgi:hypothetical protein
VGAAAVLGAGWAASATEGPNEAEGDVYGAALLVFGLLSLGAWLFIECYHLWASGNAREVESQAPDDQGV